MIITRLLGGLGNQLFCYAAGRRLAYILNTELKIDKSSYNFDKLRSYKLFEFNIQENFATPEEIQTIIENSKQRLANIVIEKNVETSHTKPFFMPEILNYPDNVYLYGYWQSEKYFVDIEDIIKNEFTLKKRGQNYQYWKNKINATECSVSLHIRRGDYVTNPKLKDIFGIISMDYYLECINCLKQTFNNFTIFVFSDDLNWCKNNLHLDLPTEFVDNVEKDVEELYLMSLCKHNIIANSSFSWWGAWLNNNPNKQVFVPDPWFINKDTANKDLIPDKWIKAPTKFNGKIEVNVSPIF